MSKHVLHSDDTHVLDEEHALSKREVIARALVHKGITLWEGIPEHIIEELGRAGYQIRKTKKLKARIKAARSSQEKTK